jgi:hypothetical protein
MIHLSPALMSIKREIGNGATWAALWGIFTVNKLLERAGRSILKPQILIFPKVEYLLKNRMKPN